MLIYRQDPDIAVMVPDTPISGSGMGGRRFPAAWTWRFPDNLRGLGLAPIAHLQGDLDRWRSRSATQSRTSATSRSTVPCPPSLAPAPAHGWWGSSPATAPERIARATRVVA